MWACSGFEMQRPTDKPLGTDKLCHDKGRGRPARPAVHRTARPRTCLRVLSRHLRSCQCTCVCSKSVRMKFSTLSFKICSI